MQRRKESKKRTMRMKKEKDDRFKQRIINRLLIIIRRTMKYG